ncbi:hypothetical protein LSAT2_031932 [Lamellibrachia satsuma]|nr:hypothetical protein LSAT2_031932 [Lamellibrachia satsuma]
MSRRCLPRMTSKCFIWVLLVLTAAGLLSFRHHRPRDIETGLSLAEDTTKPLRGAKTTLEFEKLPLQYATNSIPFNASDQVRRNFMPPSGSYHTLAPDKMADFVFVTAASSNHFAESVDAIAAIQTLMPQKKIMYFDIGLKAEQIAQVKSWCSVTYRYFNLDRLPMFASNLRICAWKPFVIETALREHSAVFWIDASFRIKGTDLSAAYRVARKNGGYVIFFRSGHSNFAVTHPGMYRYLSTDVNAQKKIVQFGGGMMLIYRTEKVFRDILWWLVMCAQEARCFMPNSSRKCTFVAHDYYKTYAKCHRFDQAAINLILSNIWIRDNSMVYKSNGTFFAVDRHATHDNLQRRHDASDWQISTHERRMCNIRVTRQRARRSRWFRANNHRLVAPSHHRNVQTNVRMTSHDAAHGQKSY